MDDCAMSARIMQSKCTCPSRDFWMCYPANRSKEFVRLPGQVGPDAPVPNTDMYVESAHEDKVKWMGKDSFRVRCPNSKTYFRIAVRNGDPKDEVVFAFLHPALFMGYSSCQLGYDENSGSGIKLYWVRTLRDQKTECRLKEVEFFTKSPDYIKAAFAIESAVVVVNRGKRPAPASETTPPPPLKRQKTDALADS